MRHSPKNGVNIKNRYPLWSIILIFLLISGTFQKVISQELPVSVMTFNIRLDNPGDGINWWENRKELVAEKLLEISPDIVGMQEVLSQQLDYLSKTLTGYSFVGVGREDGKAKGEYVPVFYKDELFSLLDQGNFWLSATPHDTGSVGWDAALPRICTWAKLKDKSSGLEFYFLNTHFDHMGDTARAESARLIAKFINNETDGLPAVLTGDFNCSPLEEPYQVLNMKETGLNDACMAANPPGIFNEETFNGFGNTEQAGRIDVIYFKGSWTVKSYEVLKIKKGDLFISDHWPVLVSLMM